MSFDIARTPTLHAVATGDGTFTYNGRAFRGSFSRTADGQIVNLVDVEQYLAAVVPAEMPPSWPLAALQEDCNAASGNARYPSNGVPIAWFSKRMNCLT